MKALITLLAIFLFLSCGRDRKREKPFIITAKQINYNDQGCLYYYQDVNGATEAFIETNTAYRLGDTIK